MASSIFERVCMLINVFSEIHMWCKLLQLIILKNMVIVEGKIYFINIPSVISDILV